MPQLAVVVFCCGLLGAATIDARAVNISNTWMLPEEGFPVFYRHFRDRVSWYEADAVCQFHHANLVTADTTSQYDAIRAYLKELDVTSNVWIGLSKTSEKAKFTWSNYQSLNGMGHWQDTIPVGSSPLCVVMDPSSDFLWKPLPCGGPEVATFICELPIPEWATGPKGCLVTEIPSLTILYIPEQSAVELTSDCGLDGTKRIACKGNADREEILKQLTCTINQDDDFDEKATKASVQITTQTDDDNSLEGKTTKPWIWTSNTIDVDYAIPTRHRRETEETLSPTSTKSTATESLADKNDARNPTKAPHSETMKFLSTVSAPIQHDTPILATLASQVKTNHPETNVDIVPTEMDHSTITATSEATQEANSATPTPDSEYPGSINQGQLFSIIENGTMFDFIELSEPDQIDQSNKDTIEVTTEAETQTDLDLDLLTVQPLVKIKKQPKEDKTYKKSAVTDKPKNILVKKPTTVDTKTLNKEVEMLPIVHDDALVLNRTFRKEVPPYVEHVTAKPHKNLSLTLLVSAQIQEPIQKPNITESMEDSPLMHHVAKKGDHRLTVQPTLELDAENSSRPYDYSDFPDASGNNSLTSEPEKTPNRSRHLTRPQRKPFYPYFFSRVLG